MTKFGDSSGGCVFLCAKMTYLVGGLEHLDYLSISYFIYGMSSFPLTFIFF